MDLLNSAKNQSSSNSSRLEYSLTEIVGVLSLIQEGMKIQEISMLTGRSVHSLRYKFFEKTALKGKEKPRSVHQYATIEALFEAHGERYSEENLQQKVNEFKAKIQQKIEG